MADVVTCNKVRSRSYPPARKVFLGEVPQTPFIGLDPFEPQCEEGATPLILRAPVPSTHAWRQTMLPYLLQFTDSRRLRVSHPSQSVV